MPSRALIMMIRDEDWEMIKSMWEEKMKWVSKVTPSMRGLFSKGSRYDMFDMVGINMFV